MEIWQIVTIALTATGLAFTVVWNLAGKPEPLKPANIRKFLAPIGSKVTSWRAARSAKRTRREEEEKEAMREAQEQPLRDALRSAVVRLHCMEQGTASYPSSEWKRQQRLCKLAVMDIIRYTGRKIEDSTISKLIIPTNYPTDSIIFDIGPSRRRPETLQLTICAHPSPRLTKDRFTSPEWFGDSKMILAKPLAESEVASLGWTFPEEWKDWHSLRIPGRSLFIPELVGPQTLRTRARLPDPNPDSPFFANGGFDYKSVPSDCLIQIPE